MEDFGKPLPHLQQARYEKRYKDKSDKVAEPKSGFFEHCSSPFFGGVRATILYEIPLWCPLKILRDSQQTLLTGGFEPRHDLDSACRS